MEKLTSIDFSCPDHPTRKLELIDPKAFANKQTFCVMCIIMSDNSKSLYNSLKSFPDFLDSIAASFANVKANLKQIPKAPQEYLDFLSKKAEALNRMTNHINDQKRKMKEAIEEIKNFFMKILEQNKAEFCKILDEQFYKFSAEYEVFEPELRMSYPRQEDLDNFFPTKEELENRFKRVENAAECDIFIRKVKKELEENKITISRSLLQDQAKRPYLDYLNKELTNIENTKPVFEVNIQVVKDELTKILDQNKTFYTLKNPIPQQSLRITAEDLSVVKAWSPEQFKANFTPKLIYKGIRDGMSPQVFHSQCDGKGPTITFIKCKFEGSSEMTVIGGFLDIHWQSNGSYLASDNSFLFSLASRIKCPISNKQYGAYQNTNNGPTFGGGHDLHIHQNLEHSYVNPHSYTNTAAIIKSPTYSGSGSIKFMPYDIEVYAINP